MNNIIIAKEILRLAREVIALDNPDGIGKGNGTDSLTEFTSVPKAPRNIPQSDHFDDKKTLFMEAINRCASSLVEEDDDAIVRYDLSVNKTKFVNAFSKRAEGRIIFDEFIGMLENDTDMQTALKEKIADTIRATQGDSQADLYKKADIEILRGNEEQFKFYFTIPSVHIIFDIKFKSND